MSGRLPVGLVLTVRCTSCDSAVYKLYADHDGRVWLIARDRPEGQRKRTDPFRVEVTDGEPFEPIDPDRMDKHDYMYALVDREHRLNDVFVTAACREHLHVVDLESAVQFLDAGNRHKKVTPAPRRRLQRALDRRDRTR